MREERAKRKERAEARQKDELFRFIMIPFLVIIFGLTVVSLLVPDRESSDQENRLLQQQPTFTMAGVADKTWMNDIEAYFADQFIGRDIWVAVKTQCDMILGKCDFNGVYMCKDHYLMKNPSTPNMANVGKNLDAINKFADTHQEINTNVLIAPNAVYTMSDRLPKGAAVRDQKKDLEWIDSNLTDKVNCIDIFEEMRKHSDEYLYYKTDHHWTSLGAMYGFLASADEIGISEPFTDYDAYTVTNDFEGTLSSTAGYHKVRDSIDVYAVQNQELKYIISDTDNTEKRVSLYDIDALDTSNKYEVFFGGNHAMVSISMVSKSKESLLVFKDSYANAYVPFLIPYYKQIIMIDPRYYYDSVDMIIENYGITDVLFLYNMDTFMGDNNIADLLNE